MWCENYGAQVAFGMPSWLWFVQDSQISLLTCEKYYVLNIWPINNIELFSTKGIQIQYRIYHLHATIIYKEYLTLFHKTCSHKDARKCYAFKARLDKIIPKSIPYFLCIVYA